MAEAEVSLRLAIHLIATGRTQSDVIVALDGAQIKTGVIQHFSVVEFLRPLGWTKLKSEEDPHWRGSYSCASTPFHIVIHSRSGEGDVTATLTSGELLIVEAKKGTLSRSKSTGEYPLLREALGQLMTLKTVPKRAVLAVAVPHGDGFVRLAKRWREAPLVRQAGIRLLTVAPTGEVDGW